MAWRVAKKLLKLKAQIDAALPNRNRSSDGSIGDAAHASRTSDHNPYIKDKNGVGVVRALDITHDPKGGLDTYSFIREFVKVPNNKKFIRYAISNHEIWNATQGWRRYTGSNPHDHHVHISVPESAALYDDETDWTLTIKPVVLTPGTGVKPQEPVTDPVLRKGSTGEAVRKLQTLLKIAVDGDFGEQTKNAVIAFQKARGLGADGVVGPYTWRALRAAPEPEKTDLTSFDRVMEWVFEDEGGMTISPDEPGSASNLGVSMTTLASHRGRKVTQAELAALKKDEAKEIYKERYWTKLIDSLPPGLNYAAFDLGINSGVGVVPDFVQRAQDYSKDVRTQIDSMMSQRLAYLRQNKNWSKYGKGWTNRIERVRFRAKSMVKP